jgi:hypothetical protein
MVTEHEVRVDRQLIEAEIKKNLLEHLRLVSLHVPLEQGKSSLPKDVQDSAELVIGLLEDKERQALERAFRLLQIVHKREDIRSVYLALSSSDRRMRSSAQEFIDVVTLPRDRGTKLEEENRELWHLITDDLPPADRVARTGDLIPPVPASYSRALSRLVRDNDEYLASLAAYHALEIDAEDLRDEVIEVYEQRPSLRVILQQATRIPRLALGAG